MANEEMSFLGISGQESSYIKKILDSLSDEEKDTVDYKKLYSRIDNVYKRLVLKDAASFATYVDPTEIVDKPKTTCRRKKVT